MYLVIAFSIEIGQILKVFTSGSTGTIFAPTALIASQVAMYVLDETITSSFGQI